MSIASTTGLGRPGLGFRPLRVPSMDMRRPTVAALDHRRRHDERLAIGSVDRQDERRSADAAGGLDEVDLVEHLVERVLGADRGEPLRVARACSTTAPAPAPSTGAGGRTARRCSARPRSRARRRRGASRSGSCPFVRRSSMIPVLMINESSGGDGVDPVVADLHLQPRRRGPRQRGDQVDVAVLRRPTRGPSGRRSRHRRVADRPGQRRAVLRPCRRRTSRGSRCPRRSRAGTGAGGRRSSRGTGTAPR